MLGGVGDAEPTPEVELRHLDTVLRGDLGVQPDDAPGGHLEAGRVEDLGPDVAVQPEQLQVRGVGEDAADRLRRCSPAEGEAELLVLVGRRDELVRVGLDPDGDPHHHPGRGPQPLGDLGEALDLLEGVDDDPPDPVGHGGLELGHRLVVAVHADPLPRHTGPHRDGELAARAHVEAQALVADPAGDLGAQEGLAGVVDVRAAAQVVEDLGVGVAEGARPGAEVVLVEDVGRGAELAGQIEDADPRHGEGPVPASADRAGPERGDERVDVGGHPQPRRMTVTVGVEGSGLVCAHAPSLGAVGGLVEATPADEAPDQVDEVVRVERLGDEGVEARATGPGALVLLEGGRDHDDREVGELW